MSICCLASTAAAQPLARQEAKMRRFDYAQVTLGTFDLRARTSLHWEQDLPYIDDVECYGQSDDISFEMTQSGKISHFHPSFLGDADERGERNQITLLGDELWLYVDGKRYEYRNISRPSRQFVNRSYPEARRSPGDIQVVPFHGYEAVRTSENEPFVDLSRIYGDLVKARKIQWGFKSRDWKHVDVRQPDNALPPGWNRRRYLIQNKGLTEALNWCAGQVTSQAAMSLPNISSTVDK